MQLIGAAAIVTLSAAAVRGVPEFRIRYHLSRLKENPSLLADVVITGPFFFCQPGRDTLGSVPSAISPPCWSWS